MPDGVSACRSKFEMPAFHSWSNAPSVFSSNPLAFRQLFEAFGGSHIGIAICDQALRFVSVNTALAEFNKIPANDHPGRFVSDVVGKLGLTVTTRLTEVLSTGRPIRNTELTGQLGANPRSGKWIENYFPIFGSRNRVIQVGVFVLSISGLRLPTSAKCEVSEERFRQIFLSSRETDLLRSLAMGQSTKKSAACLGISVKTAETYKARLMLKLHAHSLADLIHYAIRHHFIDLQG
jgi:DNA-binding CsgD family transcriptional regulator